MLRDFFSFLSLKNMIPTAMPLVPTHAVGTAQFGCEPDLHQNRFLHLERDRGSQSCYRPSGFGQTYEGSNYFCKSQLACTFVTDLTLTSVTFVLI